MTILLGALLAAVAAPPIPAAIIGRWGGDHVTLTVTAQAAILKLDCADGHFAMPVIVDRDGRFSAVGNLTRYRPGPTRGDAADTASSASYRGHIARDALTLIVSADGSRPATYLLTRNRRTKLVRCM